MANVIFQAKTGATEGSPKPNAIDQFLGIECSSETKCNETPEEEASRTTEKFLQFSCYIDKDVKYLHTGLKNRLSRIGPLDFMRCKYTLFQLRLYQSGAPLWTERQNTPKPWPSPVSPAT